MASRGWKDRFSDVVGLLGRSATQMADELMPGFTDAMTHPKSVGQVVEGLLPQDPKDVVGDAITQWRGGDRLGAVEGMLGGANIGIIPPAVAKGLRVEASLPKTEAFERAIQNTPGARIEDGTLVLPLARRQMSVQHNQPSVRGGVFYLPEGDRRLSHYNGTGYYGGQDKISGETAFSNPLFVKGATGGKAPEAAYTALTSKSDMKQLDRDVFSAVNDKYWMSRQDPSVYVERVGNLLADYGSNPEIADYLIKNSSQGNQLRYALQENIIGNKVRDAGHDAVLGYSMKRSNRGGGDPFISEIFDVRESHYPGKNGEYQIWDRYLPGLLGR